jgi:hypothetical protein
MLDNGGVHGSCLNFLRSIALIKCVPLLKTWHFYTSNRGSYVDHVTQVWLVIWYAFQVIESNGTNMYAIC